MPLAIFSLYILTKQYFRCMRVKKFILILLTSGILLVLLSPVRIYLGSEFDSLIGFVLFFLLTIYFIRKHKALLPIWIILAALILGDWLPELHMRITSFSDTLLTLPDSIIHTLGIICGFLYWRLKNPFNILTVSFGVLIVIFMFFQGYEYWYHKLNYGTFTGDVKYSLPAKFEAFDAQSTLITDNILQNKIVLLDFWYTGCGACFEKFPQVQAAYDRYKNEKSIAIFAVDQPVDEDKPGQAFQMIKDEGYSFPVLIAKDVEMAEKFGVKFYPTTFVIDRTGEIVYRGDIAGAVKMVDELKTKN